MFRQHDPLTLLPLNILIQPLLLLRQMRQAHKNLIPKLLPNLLQTQPLRLGEEIPYQRDVDRGDDDKEEVVLPAYLGEGGGGCFRYAIVERKRMERAKETPRERMWEGKISET